MPMTLDEILTALRVWENSMSESVFAGLETAKEVPANVLIVNIADVMKSFFMVLPFKRLKGDS